MGEGGESLGRESRMSARLNAVRTAAVVLSACVVSFANSNAHAQAYPVRAVRAIVPFTPGGGTDFIARVVLQKLSETWGQPVVVENRPGGTTIVASQLVSKAAPDGHPARHTGAFLDRAERREAAFRSSCAATG